MDKRQRLYREHQKPRSQD